MKNVLKILILGVLPACIPLPVAWADLLSPGESPVSHCLQIANINKYPDYWLIADIEFLPSPSSAHNKILKQGECLKINGYYQRTNIYAIKKSQVSAQEIITTQEGEALKDFNSKKNQLIPAKKKIGPIRTMSNRYGIKEVTDIIKIVKITPESLDLSNKEVIYAFGGKAPEKKVYKTQDERPLPSDNRTSHCMKAGDHKVCFNLGFY